MGVASLDLLDRLIAFPTVSLQSNRDMIAFMRAILDEAGARVAEFEAPPASNLNLFATIGPADRGGVALSGHTDVVPTHGQHWTTDPFRLTRRGDRLYGRGTADMKGFLACALRAASLAGERDLVTPLHLGLFLRRGDRMRGRASHARRVGAAADPAVPACIVGEPTSMPAGNRSTRARSPCRRPAEAGRDTPPSRQGCSIP